MSDSHDVAHRVVDMRVMPGTGMAVLVEMSPDDMHLQLVLVEGEGPRELLACWEADYPDYYSTWAADFTDIVDILSHVVAHSAAGVPPSEPCPLDLGVSERHGTTWS